MKKFGIFWVFAFFFSMLTFFAVDDGGAGGDDEEIDDDIGDFEIDDDELEDDKGDDGKEKKPKEPPSEKKESGELDEIKKRLEESEKALQELKAKEALLKVESELSKKYDGFSLEKVHQKLMEMEKENPGSGKEYNSPLGFELLWLKEFAKQGKDVDGFDRGREVKSEPFDVEKVYEKIAKGDSDAKLELLKNSK